MRNRGRIAGAVVATLALALPAAADAKKIKHRGSIQGVASAKVQFKVTKKNGDLIKVSGLRFKKVPVQCDDGAQGSITASIPTFPLQGKKFTRKGPIRGPGINNGTLRAFGKIRGGGRRAKGNVRIAFKSDGGAGCGTGKLNWKTS
jgi:hypothetical protein